MKAIEIETRLHLARVRIVKCATIVCSMIAAYVAAAYPEHTTAVAVVYAVTSIVAIA